MGGRGLGGLLALSLGPLAHAGTTHTLRFDEAIQPTLFDDQPRYPSEQYPQLTLRFESNGPKVLDLQSFSVSGHSLPNGLAYNVGSGVPGSQQFGFTRPVNQFTVRAGGLSGSVTLSCYADGNVLVDTITVPSQSQFIPLTCQSSTYVITRAILSSTANYGAYDDLSWRFNLPPVASTNGPWTGWRGVPVPMSAASSTEPDSGGIASYLWDCTNNGSYDVAGVNASCTYPALGTYTVRLQVTDLEGAVAHATRTVTIVNRLPTVDAGGPYTATRLQPASVAATGSDPDGDPLSYAWDCDNDGAFDDATGATATCGFTAVGSFTVKVRAQDGVGGSATDTATVTVHNLGPTAVIAPTAPVHVDQPVTLSGLPSFDPEGDALSHAWDCGDDGSVDSTGPTATCTFAQQGLASVRLTVTDVHGASHSTVRPLIINAPLPTAALSPQTAHEGVPLTLDVSQISDPEGRPLTLAMDCDEDGLPDATGSLLAPPACTFPDDGVVQVSVAVSAPFGATVLASAPFTVLNVDPTLAGDPPGDAFEQQLYTATLVGADVPADALSYALDQAPDGMVVEPATGAITWTPDPASVAAGSAQVLARVSDGDGGAATLGWTITVHGADADGDGMADDWELEHGFDPNDPSDGALDPDLDGRTNTVEFARGTDPAVFDGPGAPPLLAPIAHQETTATPWLQAGPAISPPGDPLQVSFEVYADPQLTTPVAASGPVPQDADGSGWTVDLALDENTAYHWRARAHDAWVDGPWSPTEPFFVNALNEAPGSPVALGPVDGGLSSPLPTLRWSAVEDPDQDLVHYDVLVWGAQGPVAQFTEVLDTGSPEVSVSFLAELPLNASFTWEVVAVDEHGLAGLPSEPATFTVVANQPPSAPALLEPADEALLQDPSPTLVATDSTDPDGDALSYRFELDTDPGFVGPDGLHAVQLAVGHQVRWDLAEDGIALEAGPEWFARVVALDTAGHASPSAVVRFRIAPQLPPPTPVLLAPLDGATLEPGPLTLEVEAVVDPDGDPVHYDFVVAQDPQLTEVLSQAQAQGTTWTSQPDLSGALYWSARAVDAGGQASPWATPFAVQVADPTPAAPEPSPERACGCSSSSGSALGGGLLALIGLLGFRRRGAGPVSP